MTELERDLRELGRRLEFPPTPDIAADIRDRIAARQARGVARRRLLAVAVAVLVVTATALLAVPSTRSAILDFFGLGGVTVKRVDELPAVAPAGELDLGERVSLAEARRRLDFAIVVPARSRYGAPDAVYLSADVPGGAVSLLYGSEDRIRLLVTQFRGDLEEPLIEKSVGGRTDVEILVVRGQPALWIEGEPHIVVFRTADGQIGESASRLAENVLVAQRDGVTVRVEGSMPLGEAIAIAESAS